MREVDCDDIKVSWNIEQKGGISMLTVTNTYFKSEQLIEIDITEAVVTRGKIAITLGETCPAIPIDAMTELLRATDETD
ncbi:MAG: hypothetical protein ACPG7F_00915 [Aggregatilineales bacterium]